MIIRSTSTSVAKMMIGVGIRNLFIIGFLSIRVLHVVDRVPVGSWYQIWKQDVEAIRSIKS